ncbi:hypothetical protein COW80_02230 [Candidatus Beckwithbacteria bacterium CG22_combo_CG10-13_8_21_14_all_01_47_9]|uniref:DUF5050 domain-containing protein n=3 Tax=Candidatus Beckwithiibacteriota TaxID=1752726 RepID=A0A2H0E2N7_9BACT|nr:MAG: hypothetical protein AUJ59_01380 [Candidatus Beckwithbacteria bacterium CG1_02_47_37]PIP88080.1 MAG: hypothetical protein COW80_02230 [Candidatus Beckwithbacteria bacterium CG22_combo_CG10-13_8_21_14_all_01_47_9]PJC66780.1 MAG: hypothetical protein CO018_00290 [Candidatus Beckwithbacteria bacterium CG_4_9_14_0_2_um_filter_47_11]
MKHATWPKLLAVIVIIFVGFFLGLNFKRLKANIISPIKDNQFIVKKWSKQCVDQNWSGDLWLYTNNQDNPKQITKGQCINKVLTLSPNRKHALVTTTSYENGSRKTLLAVVELATGATIILKDGDNYSNYGIGYWLSDREAVNFIAPRIGNNLVKIEAIDIKNKNSRLIGELPIAAFIGSNTPFSMDRQKVVMGNEEAQFMNINAGFYSFDIPSQQKYLLVTKGNLNFITWFEDRVVYVDKQNGNNNLWIINADGTNKEKLGKLEGEEISNFAVSGDRKKLTYSIKTKETNTPEIDVDHNWFSFDLINKENKKIDFNESFVGIQSLSGDGSLGSFTKKDTHELFIVDLDSLKTTKLCGSGNGCEVSWPW